MLTIKNNLRGLAIIGGFITTLLFVHAQTVTKTIQNCAVSLDDPNVDWASLSDFEVELKAIEATTPVAASSLPSVGTYISAQHALDWPPLPGNIRNLPCWPLDTNLFLISDLAINYSAKPKATQRMTAMAGNMMAMDLPAPGDGGDGGTNSYAPSGSGYTVDYSTNLWIANFALTSSNAVGTLSNSSPAIFYEIQTRQSLTSTDGWASVGFVYGSELTNWTALVMTNVSLTNNAFFRIRSWQDDGSGLPIWWQLDFFGFVGVDPYGNPAGDGWSNIQKFQLGMDPNLFYTPAAPQGLTVSYNSVNGNVNVSWLPSPGAVTGYTVEKFDGQTWQTTDFNFSSGTDGFADTVSDVPLVNGNGPDISVTYRIVAHYDTNVNSLWSDPMPLEPSNISGSIVAGPQGSAYLAVSVLPAGTVKLRLTRIDFESDFWGGNPAYDTNFDISVSTFTNGLALLPDSCLPMPIDPDYGVYYDWYAQTIDANGNLSTSAYLINVRAGPLSYNNRLVPLYFDGRQQMKDNLRFLLRAADTADSFVYIQAFTNIVPEPRTWPINYVYSGFYRSGEQGSGPQGFGPGFDVTRPIHDNYFYRNFVFDPNNLTAEGFLNTGCYYDFNDTHFLFITNHPSYFFNEEDYITAPNPIVLSSLLSADQTTWLSPDNQDGLGNVLSGARNVYGLPYVSVEDAYVTNNQLYLATYNPGDSVPDGVCYRQAAQPNFQTVGYYFANNPAPEQDGFLPTNTSSLLIEGISQQMQIFGYAKLAVLNGYSGVYAYLGQYFDRAYKKDANGNVTTTPTGVLSPYGSFFATEPGPAALVTMPDVDTGARGTCTVYCVSLALDKNHDGNMDLSFSGADATSQTSPMIFWCNNNRDRWHIVDWSDLEQDDVLPGEDGSPNNNLDPNDPDYNYKDRDGNRIIPCKRDLEDFARLWVCGVTSNLLAALPSGSTVTLNWGDVGNPNSSNPTIDLFTAADDDGGTGYLTDATIASHQIDITRCPYVHRLAPGGSIQLNSTLLQSFWLGSHYIWCGVSNGSGGLNLTIKDGSGNVLAQTTAYIQIKDIKQMYERWTVGDNPNIPPTNTAQLAANDLPVGVSRPFQYANPGNSTTPYILFVHGWNLPTWGKDRFAETAFKRLYWQGYQGRFGLFRWPTLYAFPLGEMSLQAINPDNFDTSEMQSWRAGVGLRKLLVQLNDEYPGQVRVCAHSHGNIAVGEALRTNVTLVHTYVAMQAAVPSHAYDPTTTNRFLGVWESLTPERTAQYWTNGAPCYFYSSAGATNFVNFFNPSDWALNWWQTDQNMKPDAGYDWQWVGTNAPELYTYTSLLLQTRNLYFPTDTYEIFSYITEGRCYPVGQQAGLGGVFRPLKEVDLSQAPYNFSTTHKYHSGEFRSDNMSRAPFWNAVLQRMNINP